MSVYAGCLPLVLSGPLEPSQALDLIKGLLARLLVTSSYGSCRGAGRLEGLCLEGSPRAASCSLPRLSTLRTWSMLPPAPSGLQVAAVASDTSRGPALFLVFPWPCRHSLCYTPLIIPTWSVWFLQDPEGCPIRRTVSVNIDTP